MTTSITIPVLPNGPDPGQWKRTVPLPAVAVAAAASYDGVPWMALQISVGLPIRTVERPDESANPPW
jgi:hypothetical protein